MSKFKKILKSGMKSRNLIRIFRRDLTAEQWAFLVAKLGHQIQSYQIRDIIVQCDHISFIDILNLKKGGEKQC